MLNRRITNTKRALRSIVSKLKPNTHRSAENSQPIKTFRHIHLLNTAVSSDNIGDEIIFSSAFQHLSSVLTDAYITTSSSHDGFGPASRQAAEASDLILLIGTNAISPSYHVNSHFIWRISSSDVSILRNKLVLVGVGANRYFDDIDPRQLDFFREVLSKKHIHSTRDKLGKYIIEKSGHNAVETSCPTLWDFANMNQKTASTKSESVCFTLTKHKPHPHDIDFIRILRESYSNLVFWPQQPRDYEYLKSLTKIEDIHIIPPNLASYDKFLQNEDVDVIGTRLHGTIRGLHHGKRSLVVSIDNRAREISESTGFPSIDRDDIIELLPTLIHSSEPIEIVLPTDKINTFLKQLSV